MSNHSTMKFIVNRCFWQTEFGIVRRQKLCQILSPIESDCDISREFEDAVKEEISLLDSI